MLRKPSDRRQRTNTRSASVVPFVSRRTPVVIPAVPASLLVSTQNLWRAYWKSDVAGAADPATDLGAVIRLFTLVDERERAYRAFKRRRLVKGSQGQMVLNPMGRVMHEFDAE